MEIISFEIISSKPLRKLQMNFLLRCLNRVFIPTICIEIILKKVFFFFEYNSSRLESIESEIKSKFLACRLFWMMLNLYRRHWSDKLIIGAWSLHYNVISNVIYINQCLKVVSNSLFETYSRYAFYIYVYSCIVYFIIL